LMSVLRTTKAPISMRNGTLQMKLGLEISGQALRSTPTRRRFVSSIAIGCG
jgi:hypothetical protein